MQGRRASAGLARAATLFGLGAGHETSRSTRRENDGSAHPRRQSDHRLGNIEPREDAGRLALSARPAMRLGQLSEWDVSESKAEVPLGYAVQAERAVCKWSFGQTWSQGLPVTGGVKARLPDLRGHRSGRTHRCPGLKDALRTRTSSTPPNATTSDTSQDPGAPFACRWM